MAEGGRDDPHAPPRERSTVERRIAASDAKGIGLPHARRNYVLPVLIAVAVFALFVLLRLASA
jgi:hypothetical protein